MPSEHFSFPSTFDAHDEIPTHGFLYGHRRDPLLRLFFGASKAMQCLVNRRDEVWKLVSRQLIASSIGNYDFSRQFPLYFRCIIGHRFVAFSIKYPADGASPKIEQAAYSKNCGALIYKFCYNNCMVIGKDLIAIAGFDWSACAALSKLKRRHG